MTGDALNSNAALGLSKGKSADNSATWGAMFQSQVERCWKKPYGGIEAQRAEAAFVIRLKRDGTLEAMPQPEGHPATPYLRVYQESALRAIIECQPYNLPAAFFDEWKLLRAGVHRPADLMRSLLTIAALRRVRHMTDQWIAQTCRSTRIADR